MITTRITKKTGPGRNGGNFFLTVTEHRFQGGAKTADAALHLFSQIPCLYQMFPRQIIRPVLPALIFILMSTSPVWAHKVYVFAWVENGTVYTESNFGGHHPVHGGAIKVVDQKGQVLLQGKTDDHGKFNFAVPSKVTSDLLIKLDATMGHQAHWTLTRAELTATGEKAKKELNQAMKEKAVVEAGPSMAAVATGMAVIFSICGVAFLINKKRKQHNG